MFCVYTKHIINVFGHKLFNVINRCLDEVVVQLINWDESSRAGGIKGGGSGHKDVKEREVVVTEGQRS